MNSVEESKIPDTGNADADTVKPYLKVAQVDMMVHGVWAIHKGDPIIVDKSGYAVEDTSANREKFIMYGCSNTVKINDAARKSLSAAITAASCFCRALDTNIIDGNRGAVIPAINLPLWTYAIPWQIPLKFRQCRELKITDREEEAWKSFLEKNIISELQDFSDLKKTDAELFYSANTIRAYELSPNFFSNSIKFRVIVAFVTPFSIVKQEILPVDVSLYDRLHAKFKEFEYERGIESGAGFCRCFVLGTPTGWEGVDAGLLSDNVECLCSGYDSKSGSWNMKYPPTDSKPLRDFIFRLLPETMDNMCQRIKNYVDRKAPAIVLLKTIQRDLGMDMALVEKCCDKIQQEVGYANEYVKDINDGELYPVIRKVKIGEKVSNLYFSPDNKKSYLKSFFSVCVKSFCTGGWLVTLGIQFYPVIAKGKQLSWSLLAESLQYTAYIYVLNLGIGIFKRYFSKD